MKKHNSILIAVTILALAAMSCNVQFATPTFTPTPAPAGPLPGPDNAGPGNPIPQGPDMVGPENPVPQGPGPNPNEGQGQILSFTADRTMVNKGECTMLHWETQGGFGVILNEQPVERSGGQQVCPPQTTVYGLGLDIGNQMLKREVTITVNGSGQNPNPIATTVTSKTKKPGPKPDIAVTPSSPNIQILPVTLVVANLNLAIVNIFVRPGDGHVMATFRNAGNTNLNTTTTLKCANGTGNGALVSTKTVTLDLKPGEIFNQDTGWTKQTAATLTCSFTPPSGDTHHNDDSMTTTIQ